MNGTGWKVAAVLWGSLTLVGMTWASSVGEASKGNTEKIVKVELKQKGLERDLAHYAEQLDRIEGKIDELRKWRPSVK